MSGETYTGTETNLDQTGDTFIRCFSPVTGPEKRFVKGLIASTRLAAAVASAYTISSLRSPYIVHALGLGDSQMNGVSNVDGIRSEPPDERSQILAAEVPETNRSSSSEVRLQELRDLRLRHLNLNRSAYTGGIAMLVIGMVSYFIFPHLPFLPSVPPLASAGLAIYGAILLAWGSRANVRDIDLEIQQLENDVALFGVTKTALERKAEILMQSQRIQLEKYYDSVLNQSRTIFFVGLISLFGGFAVIAITMYLIVSNTTSGTSEQIIVGALGIISGMLANFIGVVYLRMFSHIAQSLSDFHDRLVWTYQIHFANLLASALEHEDLRERTISDIALKIPLSNKRVNRKEHIEEDSGADGGKLTKNE